MILYNAQISGGGSEIEEEDDQPKAPLSKFREKCSLWLMQDEYFPGDLDDLL